MWQQRSKDQMEFQFLILFRLWDSSHICDSFGLHLRPSLIVETNALSWWRSVRSSLERVESSWPCCCKALVQLANCFHRNYQMVTTKFHCRHGMAHHFAFLHLPLIIIIATTLTIQCVDNSSRGWRRTSTNSSGRSQDYLNERFISTLQKCRSWRQPASWVSIGMSQRCSVVERR